MQTLCRIKDRETFTPELEVKLTELMRKDFQVQIGFLKIYTAVKATINLYVVLYNNPNQYLIDFLRGWICATMQNWSISANVE